MNVGKMLQMPLRSPLRLRSERTLSHGILAVLAACLIFLPGCTQSLSISGTTGSSGSSVTLNYTVVFDPPGSYLCNFNAGQALLNLSLSNASISSTSGTAVMTVTDATNGSTLGQESVGWVVNGTSIYAQNPTALQNWLGQFCSYSDVAVNVQAAPQLQTTTYGSASATAAVEYQGTTYASTTNSWDYTNPKQQCDPSPCRLAPKN